MARSLPNGIDTRFSRILPPSGGGVIPSDNLVLVVLESVEIKKLYSMDRTIRSNPGRVPRGLSPTGPKANREGTLNIQVAAIGGGKAGKLFNWKTDEDGNVVKASDLEGVLLYYGPAKAGLHFSVQLIEEDKEDSEDLESAKKTIGYLKQASGFVPVYGAPIGLGLSFLNSLFSLLQATVKDSLELNHSGSVGIPNGAASSLQEGVYTIVRHENRDVTAVVPETDWHLAIKIRVIGIPAPAANFQKQKVSLLLNRLELETERETKMLFFESAFGSGKEASAFGFSGMVQGNGNRSKVDLSDVVGLSDASVWSGAWGIGIPFNISGHLAPSDTATMKALEGVISSGSAIVGNFLQPEDVEAAKIGTAVAQTARQLALEFWPKKSTLGLKQGFLVPKEFYDTIPNSAKKYFYAPDSNLIGGQNLPHKIACPPMKLWEDPVVDKDNFAYFSIVQLS